MSTSISTASPDAGQLCDLARRINEAHHDTLTAARTTLEHARRVGELLIEAKSAVGHGQWLPWLQENVTFSVATAGRYVKVARNWDKVNSSSVTNLTEATALLAEPADKDDAAEPPPNRRRPFHELPDESRADLCKKWWDIQASRTVLYHAAGWTVPQIVDLVQAPEHEVNSVLTPRIRILFGNPGAKLFDDERGEERYRQVVEAHLHGLLRTAYWHASWAAEHEGFPELEIPLSSIAKSHERLADSLPKWLFVDCQEPGFEVAVNALSITDSRKALGVYSEADDLLVFRVAKLMNVIEDIDNHIDDEIDWVALNSASRVRELAIEHDFNPATFRPWNENADREQCGGAA